MFRLQGDPLVAGAWMITHSPSGDTSPLSRNDTVGIRSKPVPSVLIRASALPFASDRKINSPGAPKDT